MGVSRFERELRAPCEATATVIGATTKLLGWNQRALAHIALAFRLRAA